MPSQTVLFSELVTLTVLHRIDCLPCGMVPCGVPCGMVAISWWAGGFFQRLVMAVMSLGEVQVKLPCRDTAATRWLWWLAHSAGVSMAGGSPTIFRQFQVCPGPWKRMQQRVSLGIMRAVWEVCFSSSHTSSFLACFPPWGPGKESYHQWWVVTMAEPCFLYQQGEWEGQHIWGLLWQCHLNEGVVGCSCLA